MSTYDETVALCALNRIFGYHPHLALELMEKAGSALALFDGTYAALGMGQETLSSAKIIADAPEKASRPNNPEATSALMNLLPQLVPSQLEWAAAELEKVQEWGCRFVNMLDEDYRDTVKNYDALLTETHVVEYFESLSGCSAECCGKTYTLNLKTIVYRFTPNET